MYTIASSPSDWLVSLLECTRHGLTFFEAVRDDTQQIIDFRLKVANRAGLYWLNIGETSSPEATIKALYPWAIQTGFFDELVRVSETGTPAEREQRYPVIDRWVRLTTRQVGEGIAIAFEDINDIKQTDIATYPTHRIVNTTQQILDDFPASGVLFEAVRDQENQLVDLRYLAINKKAEQSLYKDAGQLIGQRLSVSFPQTLHNGFITRCLEVFATGQPQEFEVEDYDHWFRVSVSQHNNDLIVTFLDITDIRIAQQEKQQQAELLRSVLDGSQNAIIAFDAVRNEEGKIVDLRYVLQNEANRQRVNRTDEQVIGHTMAEYFPSVKTNGLLEHYSQVIETGIPYREEIAFDYGNGPGWYNLSVVKRGDGMVLTVQDKTAEKTAELTILEQTETLQGILDTIPSGVFVSKAIRDSEGYIVDFQIIEANRVALQVTGHHRAGTIGQLASLLFPEDRTNGSFERFVKVVESGQPIRYEMNWNSFWLDVQMVPLGTDQVIVSYADITLLKLAQQEQQRQAEFLDKIISTSHNAIIAFEAIRNQHEQLVDFRCTYHNPAALAIMNVTTDDIQTYTLLACFPPEQYPGHFQFYLDLFLIGKPFREEKYYQHLNKWLDISGAIFGDGFLLSFTDITANRLNLHRVEQANLELRRSNEHLQQFAYVASHDLQEPLRKIQQFGDMLQNQYGPELGDAGIDIIQRMQRSSVRMGILIKDLLAYSRVSTQRQPFQQVSISSLLNEVLDDLEVAIIDSRARIEHGELPYILGDKAQLRQLFQNLISNAIKFRRSDTSPNIRITYRLVKAGDLAPGVLIPILATEVHPRSVNQSFFEISVTDNGIGFDEKYLDRIFQVFQRLHSRADYPGTGVGLAICRKVVENHGGGITATGQPGVGATFHIYLPAEPSA